MGFLLSDGENGEVLKQPLAANGTGATSDALETRLPQEKVNAAVSPSRSMIGGLLRPDARRRVLAEERALAHVGEQYVSAPVARDVEARGSAGLFGTPAGNVTVASGFTVGTADLVIDVTGWWR
jgi:hypothetical protein